MHARTAGESAGAIFAASPPPIHAMRTILAVALAASVLFPVALRADELDLQSTPDAPASAPAPAELPKKGLLQSQVLKTFGEPQTRHAPVGGDSAKHPPITRWDYPGFTVIFEQGHVVDAVVPGKPAPIFHTEQLAPANS